MFYHYKKKELKRPDYNLKYLTYKHTRMMFKSLFLGKK